MINTSITVAQNSQADEIADLVNSAYRGESAKSGWTNESALLTGSRTSASAVRDLISSETDAVLVRFDETKSVIGCVHLEKKNEILVYLGMLTIDPKAQARGLGSELMAAAEAYAKKVFGASMIEMTVIDVRDELIAYYKRRGYRVTGEKRPFPEEAVNGQSLIGKISFDVLVKDIG